VPIVFGKLAARILERNPSMILRTRIPVAKSPFCGVDARLGAPDR
jgi:hypothetical protein